MDKTSPILQVDNLSVSYDKSQVLTDLSFQVNRKDVLVILGPNGAGKTTLLRAMLGLIPYEGKVKWQTKKISYLPPKEFLQRKNLPPLTLEEFFLFKTKDKSAISEMFYRVGLDSELLKNQFGALSTGQFQRMLIAWALVDKPEILLFDEPTSGIDIGGEETIYTLLHKFWEEQNLTIILVTHDLNIVWEHANQVLCLNKQRMCLGKPNEVLTPEQLKQLYGTVTNRWPPRAPDYARYRNRIRLRL
jgi:zinc transport system ATP-binding protein